jgi:predicted O-methyltransferase YrrM
LRTPGLIFKELVSGFKARGNHDASDTHSMLTAALQAYRDKNIIPSENQDLLRIESLRDQLLRSKAAIEKTEFGAGSRSLENNKNLELVRKVCRVSSKNKDACLLLYHIVKSLKPGRSLELGTCLGISSAYLATGLKHNGFGKLTTMEGSPGRADIARDTFHGLELSEIEVLEGKFNSTLDPFLKNHGQLDFVFIDGHHEEHATLRYFDTIMPSLHSGSIVVVDDVFWSAGMHRAWDAILYSGSFNQHVIYKGMGIGVIR